MTYTQVAAIVEQYMNAHPTRWDEVVPAIIWTALKEACGP